MKNRFYKVAYIAQNVKIRSWNNGSVINLFIFNKYKQTNELVLYDNPVIYFL